MTIFILMMIYSTVFRPHACVGSAGRSGGVGSEPHLVKDLNLAGVSSETSHMVKIGDILYFAANDGIYGKELWQSDGTPQGSRLIKDIIPGKSGSDPQGFVNLAGRVLFAAQDGSGWGLWITDGTENGTQLLRTFDAMPHFIVPKNNQAFFVVDDSLSHGLWKTDGTPAGTQQVRPFASGAIDTPLTVFHEKVYFHSIDDNSALWSSDGTVEGTAPVYHFFNINEMLVYGNDLYFSVIAIDATQGLWKTDGTALGTTLVKSFSGFPIDLKINDGWLYFTLYYSYRKGLWRSNGTENGTLQIEDDSFQPYESVFLNGELIAAGYKDDFCGLWKTDGSPNALSLVQGCSGAYPPAWLTVSNGFLFYSNFYNNNDALWKSDGTSQGTSVVHTFPTFHRNYPWSLIDFDNHLFFVASDSSVGEELWMSDGTMDGTKVFKDLNPATDSSDPSLFTSLAGKLIFAASDVTGRGVWTTDGIITGTQLLQASYPLQMTSAGWQVFFMDGSNLWRTNGTIQGTSLITTSTYTMRSLTSAGENIFLVIDTSSRSNPCDPQLLYEVESTTGAVSMLKNFGECSLVDQLTAIGDRLLFALNSTELWQSDGTPAGTQKVLSVESGSIRSFFGINDRLYFTVENLNTKSYALWTVDDSAARLIKEFISPQFYIQIDSLAGAGEALFFSVYDSNDDTYELWKSNVLTSDTVLVKEFSELSGLTYRANRLFFAAAPVLPEDQHGVELWSSDGTSENTAMIKDIWPGSASSSPNHLAVIGSNLYFSADDGVHGAELWQSDGTEAGTFLLADLEIGISGSSPANYFYVMPNLYFTADVFPYGREVWRFEPFPILKDYLPLVIR